MVEIWVDEECNFLSNNFYLLLIVELTIDI